MKIYVGIDPGKSGAMAWLTDDVDDGLKSLYTKNTDALDLDSWFKIFKEQTDEIYITIEKVWSFPKDSNKAAFSFGTNYGMWLTLLETNELSYQDALPRKWQEYFKIPKMKKQERKLLCKEKAMEYLKEYDEDYRVTYINADAILIAMFSKHINEPCPSQSS